MTTRRDILKGGAGIAAILASGKAPAYLVKSMLASRQGIGVSASNKEEEMYKEILIGMIEGVIQPYTIPGPTVINQGVFYDNSIPTGLVFPDAKTVGVNGLRGMSRLVSVSLPVCETISASAFQGDLNLESIDMPNVKTISNNAFQSCQKLTSISLPSLIGATATAFSPTYLSNISLPNLSCSATMAKQYFPWGAPTTCVFTCSDGTIAWNGSGWAATPSAQNGGGA